MRTSLLDNLKDEDKSSESSIKKLIRSAPPASFLIKEGKLRGSASNDIVLMAALKGNGQTLPVSLRDEEEEIEEEQELIREKKKEVLDEELETELEKEELLEEERDPNLISEMERDRLDEEEVEAEREAVLLEESGYPVPIDSKYTGARRLIRSYIGEDGRMHYEPLSYSTMGHHNGFNHNNFNGLNNFNNHHLTYLLSHCLPVKYHHLIEQCRDSMGYHNF